MSLQAALVDLPGLAISLHPDLLSVAGGTARLHFTVSAESLDFDGDALFEIFERNRGRVSWRARFHSATPMTWAGAPDARSWRVGVACSVTDLPSSGHIAASAALTGPGTGIRGRR